MNPIACTRLSKWYGEVLGVQDLTLALASGITAVVGPNGAGKSTLFRLWTGALRPSQGTVRVFGADPWADRGALLRLGFAPEGEGVPGRLAGRAWVEGLAILSGLSAAAARVRAGEALRRARLAEEAWDRPLATYSNGMRQKAKLAQAMAHRPELLVLDEPMSGIDPVSRHDLAGILRELVAEGVSIVLSSHNLAEVERLTDRIALLFRGRLVASGSVREVRSLIDRYPYRVRVECAEARELARRLAARRDVVGVSFPAPGVLVAETFQAEGLLSDMTGILADLPGEIRGFWPEDERLEAVFSYLTEGASGSAWGRSPSWGGGREGGSP